MSTRIDVLRAGLRKLRIALPFLGRYRARIAVLIALGIGSSFAEGASVALVAEALGTLLGGGGAVSQVSGRPGLLLLVVGALLTVRAVAAAYYDLLGETLSARVTHDVRVAVFGRFVNGSFDTIGRRGVGSLLNTLEWELFAIPEAVGALAAITMDAIAIAIYAGFLFAVSWRLAVLGAVAGLVLLPLSAVTTPRLRRLSERMRLGFEALATVQVSTIEALRTVKLFGAEREATERQRAASVASTGALLAIARHNVVVRVVRRIAVLALAAIFLVIVSRSGIPHATALTAIALLYRLVPHAQSMEGRVTGILGDAGRIRSTLDALDAEGPSAAEPARTDPERADVQRADPARADETTDARAVPFRTIALTGIRYRYGPAHEPALDGVDLLLARGSFTAITGPSGGGKTTLVNLLARLWRPTGGAIRVDERALAEIGRDEWLATVAFAGQDVELLRGTVRDNLLMGRPGLDDGALWEALEIANAASFVRALDGGLEAEVGDHGRSLSGGQRQRLVLARALARRPCLLVLDEATNAVDPDMERAIHHSIRRTRPDLTILSVTHRGDTSDADLIVTIDLGRITSVVTGERGRAGPVPQQRGSVR